MTTTEVIKVLISFIANADEFLQLNTLNPHVRTTIQTCWKYCLDHSEKSARKSLEIESVLDYLQDELNTGHWSEVPMETRRAFTVSSYIKTVITLINSPEASSLVELWRNCLKCLDLGLLLGAPLTAPNCDLLTTSAKYFTELLNENQAVVVKTKRKLDEMDDKINLEGFYGLKGKLVDVVECPSLETFNKRYFVTQIPVKLTGCMSHWPASKKWPDVNYLLRIAGDRTVPVEIGSHYVDENWTQKLMTLKEFITNHYLSDKSSDLGYLAQHNLFEQITELREDISIPEYCSLSLDYTRSSDEDPDINAWFGPGGTVSPLHTDPKNNILCQVLGTKQVILFPPQDTPYLYPHEGRLLFNTAQVNPVEPNLDKHPDFSRASMYKCLLQPGEMLFIPVKWWHHVTAFDKSFSVSFWWQ